MTWRGSPQRWWLLALGLLAAVTAAGVAVFTARYVSMPQPVEIVVASTDNESPVEVYLTGAGIREGVYTVGQDATLDDILPILRERERRCELDRQSRARRVAKKKI